MHHNSHLEVSDLYVSHMGVSQFTFRARTFRTWTFCTRYIRPETFCIMTYRPETFRFVSHLDASDPDVFHTRSFQIWMFRTRTFSTRTFWICTIRGETFPPVILDHGNSQPVISDPNSLKLKLALTMKLPYFRFPRAPTELQYFQIFNASAITTELIFS